MLVTSRHGTVVEINGTYGSLRMVLQFSEVLSELKLWEKELKLGIFNLRLEVYGKDGNKCSITVVMFVLGLQEHSY